MRRVLHPVRRFFRTPKGLLTIVLAALTAVAVPVEGWRLAGPQLVAAVAAAALVDVVDSPRPEPRLGIPERRGADRPDRRDGPEPARGVARERAPRRSIAVVSKYLVRTRSANVFNPAALALVATYYVFDSGQSWWGALPELPPLALALLLAAGVFIADRVNKLPLVLVFLGVYYLLFTATAFVGNPGQVAEIFRAPDLHAVLYFAFFILTDPPTSPPRYRDQIICALLVAGVSYAVFEWIGAVYYLLAGVLAGNLLEAGRRVQVTRKKRMAASVHSGRSSSSMNTAPGTGLSR